MTPRKVTLLRVGSGLQRPTRRIIHGRATRRAVRDAVPRASLAVAVPGTNGMTPVHSRIVATLPSAPNTTPASRQRRRQASNTPTSGRIDERRPGNVNANTRCRWFGVQVGVDRPPDGGTCRQVNVAGECQLDPVRRVQIRSRRSVSQQDSFSSRAAGLRCIG
jgi:hypothetical protein